MVKRIFIVGAGAFGFGIAKVLSENLKNRKDKKIYLYDKNKKIIKYLKEKREHPIFNQNIKLDKNISFETTLKKIERSDLLILAIPSRHTREGLKEIKKYLKKETKKPNKEIIILNLAKGIEIKTNKRISEIIFEEFSKEEINYTYSILSGTMNAKEMINREPVFATLTSEKIEITNKIKEFFENEYIKIETTNDLIGTELAGPFKNIIAIGAGIIDGLNLNGSTKSGFVTCFSKELTELGIKLGGKKETFLNWTYAYAADIIGSSFGESRNREFGELIGKGIEPKKALEIMKKNHKELEGFNSINSIYELSKKNNLLKKTQILQKLYKILNSEIEPKKIIKF